MSSTLPFINRYAAIPCNSAGRDEATSEDTLPAIVEVTADGLVRERTTRLTDVKKGDH